MPLRQRVLLVILVVGLAAMVVSGSLSPNSSFGDVAFAAIFSVFFFFIVFLTLKSRGNETAEGHRGLPRWLWVLFASYAAAFALAMFGAVLSLPWLGYRGFDFFLGGESNEWVLLVLAAIVYPFVNRRLL